MVVIYFMVGKCRMDCHKTEECCCISLSISIVFCRIYLFHVLNEKKRRGGKPKSKIIRGNFDILKYDKGTL